MKQKISFFLLFFLSCACYSMAIESPKGFQFETESGNWISVIPGGASRTTGVAPLSVFFNAGLTPSSPTERSFHDYEYSWNFGDGSSGNWGTDGKSKNSDKGPVSAHVYEKPGMYVATLTIQDANGIVATEIFNITVENPQIVFSGTNTICVSDATSKDFVGCPAGAQTIATNSLSSMQTWLTSSHRVLLRRGSKWSTAAELVGSTSVTKARLGAYGTCTSPDANGICANAPQITSTLSTASLFSLHYKNDFVIQDLSFVAPKFSNVAASITSGGKDLTGFMFFRNKVRGFYTGISWYHSRDETHPGSPTDMSVVACDIRDFYGYAQYGGGENLFVTGNQFHNSDITHISRVWWAYKGVYSHNMVSGASLTNSQARVALKLHGPKSSPSQLPGSTKIKEVGTFEETGGGGLPYSNQYIVVADNVFGSSGSRPVDILPQDIYSDERIYDVIFERNKMIQDYGRHSSKPWQKAFHILGYYITARNNIFDASYADGNLTGLTQIEIENYDFMPTPTGTHIYNNTFYGKGDDLVNGVTGVRVFAGVTGAVIRNNYLSYPDATSTRTIVDDQSGLAMVSDNVMTNAPAFVDPDNSDPLLRNFGLKPQAKEAINQGYTSPVLDDFAETSRMGTYDIGAYEYISSPSGSSPSSPSDGECLSGSAIISQTTADLSNVSFSSESDAQSFSWGSTFSLYSISFNILNDVYTSGFKMRIGTSNDLSGTCGIGNTCLEELDLAPTGAGIYEAVSATHPQLTAGTMYYFALTSTAADSIRIYYNSTSVAKTGVGQRYKSSSTGTFNNDMSREANDLYFVIKSCD